MRRMRRILIAVQLLALCWCWSTAALADPPPEALEAHADGEYLKAIDLLENQLEREPDDADSQRLLLDCYRAVFATDMMGEVLRHAEGALEHGTLVKLGLDTIGKAQLDEFQDMARLPDVASLREIDSLGSFAKALDFKRVKTVQDYLSMARFYEKLGDMDALLGGLKNVLELDPDHAQANLKLGLMLVEENKPDEAEAYFIRFLNADGAQVGSVLGLYALAFVNARPFALGSLALVMLGALLIFMRTLGGTGRRLWLVPLILVCTIVSVAGGAWWQQRSLASFLVILALVSAVVLAFSGWTFKAHGGRVLAIVEWFLKRIFRGVQALGSGRVSGRLAELPIRYLVLMLLLLPPLMASVVGAVEQYDIRLAALVAMGIVLFTVIGALSLSFLKRNTSLGRTLRYISLFNTIPFLIVFVYLAGGVLEKLLFLSFNSLDAWESRLFVASSALYLLGLAFAMYLAVIQTQAILKPVRALTDGVRAVERGELDVHIPEQSADELGVLSRGFNRMVAGLRQREFIRTTFGRFVDPRVVEDVLARGRVDLKGKTAHCVVMFTDIRGFTSLSERVAPDELVPVLNDYFTRMVAVIERHGGLVNKYIGDAMMVVWGGLTDAAPDPAVAIRTALEMQAELRAFNAARRDLGGFALAMGVGINMGEVVAGHIGSRDRLEWTVMGDNVNLAQRAESLAKDGQVLVTPWTFASVAEAFVGQQLAAMPVKGKQEPVAFVNVVAETKTAPSD